MPTPPSPKPSAPGREVLGTLTNNWSAHPLSDAGLDPQPPQRRRPSRFSPISQTISLVLGVRSGGHDSEGVLGSLALLGHQELTKPLTVPNGHGPPTRMTASDHSGLLLLRHQPRGSTGSALGSHAVW